MSTQPVSQDSYQLLGGRLTMLSAAGGYRASIDPVLLAAAVPAKKGEQILDVGCGSGAAALCLTTRLDQVHVTGIEVQEPLVALAREISELNKLAERTTFLHTDLLRPGDTFQKMTFDHVMANPPHHKKGSGNPSPDPMKAAANIEGAAALHDWVAFCYATVVEGGSITFVHRFDRQDELVSLMVDQGSAVTVLPLWPKVAGKGAKRVIVQAIKGDVGAVNHLPGLVLHAGADEYTGQAHAILRSGAALNL